MKIFAYTLLAVIWILLMILISYLDNRWYDGLIITVATAAMIALLFWIGNQLTK